jgi:hypothetical protein
VRQRAQRFDKRDRKMFYVTTLSVTDDYVVSVSYERNMSMEQRWQGGAKEFGQNPVSVQIRHGLVWD